MNNRGNLNFGGGNGGGGTFKKNSAQKIISGNNNDNNNQPVTGRAGKDPININKLRQLAAKRILPQKMSDAEKREIRNAKDTLEKLEREKRSVKKKALQEYKSKITLLKKIILGTSNDEQLIRLVGGRNFINQMSTNKEELYKKISNNLNNIYNRILGNNISTLINREKNILYKVIYNNSKEKIDLNKIKKITSAFIKIKTTGNNVINNVINSKIKEYKRFGYNVPVTEKQKILESLLTNDSMYKVHDKFINKNINEGEFKRILQSYINTKLNKKIPQNKKILNNWLKKPNQNEKLKKQLNEKAKRLANRTIINNNSSKYNSNNNTLLPYTSKKLKSMNVSKILNSFNDNEMQNILTSNNPIKKIVSLYKQKFKVEENISTSNELNKILRFADPSHRENNMRKIKLKRERPLTRNVKNNINKKRELLEASRRLKRGKSNLNRRQNNLKNTLTKNKMIKLKMSDKIYIEFIELIYNDMIHDETMGENPIQMFNENVIPILVNKKNNQIPNIKINIPNRITKRSADNYSNKTLKQKLVNLKKNTVVVPRFVQNNNNEIIKLKTDSDLTPLNIVFDSDYKDLIKKHVFTKDSKFKELLTLGGLLDPGRGMCGTSILTKKRRFNTNSKPIITEKFTIDTRPLIFSIESPNYSTKFEVNYNCSSNNPIKLKVNDKPITVVSRTAVRGDPEKAVGKMCGDLLQILSVIRNNATGYTTGFATFDRSAAYIFLFLSDIYRSNSKGALKEGLNSKYKDVKNNQKVQEIIRRELQNYDNEYLKPKLIWLQQGGQRTNNNGRASIFFIHLKEYISSIYYADSNITLNLYKEPNNVRVVPAQSLRIPIRTFGFTPPQQRRRPT